MKTGVIYYPLRFYKSEALVSTEKRYCNKI
jgi:hypothetical protein